MAMRRTSGANAVRTPMTEDEANRLQLDCVDRVALQMKGWPKVDPREGFKAPRVTKAQVRRVIEAARAAGFDPEEVEIEGVVLRRRGGVTVLTEPPAGELDIEAEIAAWAGRNGLG